MKLINLQTESVKNKYPFFFKIANYFRNKRFNFFIKELNLTGKEKILDVGGTFHFWLNIDSFENITILNLYHDRSNDRIKNVVYDGSVFPFDDKSFDVVFSNSTIEHVGDFLDKQKFANEIQRVSKKYFVQTPSFWFPYEPHAMIPFFQFIPANLQMVLHKLIKKSEYPIEELLSIKLLTKKELKYLFPGSKIKTEKFLLWTKSYFIISKEN